MAEVIHAADVAADIDKTLLRGTGSNHGRYGIRYPDDEENLSLQFEVYDALYAWYMVQTAQN